MLGALRAGDYLITNTRFTRESGRLADGLFTVGCRSKADRHIFVNPFMRDAQHEYVFDAFKLAGD